MPWGEVSWEDEDIEVVFERRNIEPTEENIAKVREIAKRWIADAMIAEGWNFLYNTVDDMLYTGELKEATTYAVVDDDGNVYAHDIRTWYEADCIMANIEPKPEGLEIIAMDD